MLAPNWNMSFEVSVSIFSEMFHINAVRFFLNLNQINSFVTDSQTQFIICDWRDSFSVGLLLVSSPPWLIWRFNRSSRLVALKQMARGCFLLPFLSTELARLTCLRVEVLEVNGTWVSPFRYNFFNTYFCFTDDWGHWSITSLNLCSSRFIIQKSSTCNQLVYIWHFLDGE